MTCPRSLIETSNRNIEENDDSYSFSNDNTTSDQTTEILPLLTNEKGTSITWLIKQMDTHYDTCLVLGISF